MADFKGARAELQVRTAAQHIWAAGSHLLQYKREESVPGPIRRAIHRVSALLEIVDQEFERVLQERDAYSRSGVEHTPSQPLDVDLLAKLMDRTLPKANRSEGEDYSSLLAELGAAGVEHVRGFNELIQAKLKSVLRLERRVVNAAKKAIKQGKAEFGRVTVEVGGGLYTAEIDRAETGLFFTHTGMVRHMFGKRSAPARVPARKRARRGRA